MFVLSVTITNTNINIWKEYKEWKHIKNKNNCMY